MENKPIEAVDLLGLQTTDSVSSNPATAAEALAMTKGMTVEELALLTLRNSCKKLADNELKKFWKNEVHAIKDVIKKQFKKELKKNGDKNFDCLIDKAGNLWLKGNKSGEMIPTKLPPSSFM